MTDDPPVATKVSAMIRNPLNRRTVLASGLAAFASTAILAKAPPNDITLEQDFDELWETLRDRYAFFEDKATDWEKVRSLYRPRLAEVGDDEDKWKRLLLAVTDELYDAHTHFAQPVPGLPRWPLSDIFLRETNSGFEVSALREGSGALEAGLKVGDQVVGIDGMTFEQAVALRMPRTLRRPDPEARRFAVNAAVGGNRDRDRKLRVRLKDGEVRDLLVPFRPVADRPAISHRRLDGGFGYIAITTFGDNGAPGAFDAALAELRDAPGLVIDTRFNGGGDTAIARPIMGRFIKERRPYALMRRRSGKGIGLTDPWTEYVGAEAWRKAFRWG